MSAEKSPRELAAAEVEAHRAVVARWEAEKAAATAELESLQERAGEEVLADESAAVRLSRTMQDLRDKIDIASRAVAAATPKMDAAARVAILAEADEWDAEKALRQAVLDKFDAQAQKLLDALQEFTGCPWQVWQPEFTSSSVASSGDLGPSPRFAEQNPREPLLDAVRVAERTAWCLREIADGRDPHNELAEPFEGPMWRGLVNGPDPAKFYPPSVWGPQAILPAPAYSRSQS